MAEFDSAKGAFYLVAIIIVAQVVIAMLVVGGCLVGILDHMVEAGTCKDIKDSILELFQMSFTAAIAFAGGRMSAPSPPSPKLPPERNEKDG